MKLRHHQQYFIDSDPGIHMLLWSMRLGKSLPAKLWSLKPHRKGNVIIISMKSNKKDWQDLCPHATVYSKEEFKKVWKDIENPTALIVDESHFFNSPLFMAKKRSAMAEALYNFISKHENLPRLFLSATPLSNEPASCHTALTYLGHDIDWKKYRDIFYTLEKRPFLPYPAWLPNKDWRKEANKMLERSSRISIVSLQDCADVPPETDEVLEVRGKKYEHDEEYHWTKEHRHAQTFKIPKIKELGYGHRKLIIVCHYTDTIDLYAKKLKGQKDVFVLDGRTKDQGQIIKDAQESSDCYLIVQAQMGMGYDGYMFDAMVFTSMPHKVSYYSQMRGRLVSLDHPKPRLYYHILSGQWDKRIHKDVLNGEDFNILKYEKVTA